MPPEVHRDGWDLDVLPVEHTVWDEAVKPLPQHDVKACLVRPLWLAVGDGLVMLPPQCDSQDGRATLAHSGKRGVDGTVAHSACVLLDLMVIAC